MRMSPFVRRATVVLTAAVALGLTTGCHRDPNKQKVRYLESGKRYFDEGKLKEASIQFSNALKIDHNYGDAHYQLSRVYVKQGNMMPAYGELRRTVDLQPGNIQARIDLGNILLAGRQPAKAAEQAKAVLAINSNNADAHSLLSNIALVQNDKTEALSQIQQAIAIEPNRASFHVQLGLLQSADPTAEAASEEELQKAISLDNKSTTAHLALAAALEKKGDRPGAEKQLQTAIAADPKSLSARAYLANLYLRENAPDKAEATLKQAAEDQSDTEAVASMLATFYIRSRQLDRGIATYADLVAKHPKSVPLKTSYVRLLILNKDLPTARSVVAQLAKTDGMNPDVAVLNSMLLLNDGKTNEAFDILQKAAKATPDSLAVKLWLGRAARAKGDTATAQQAFRDAAKINPRSMEAQSGLAELSIESHDDTTLTEIAKTVMAANPQSALPYIWRGIAEANQKSYDAADADFHQAIKLDATNSTPYLELAQLRLAQQKPAEANPLAEQALQYNPNSTSALRILATALVMEKQPAKAVSRVQEQISKAPQNADMYALLADLQMGTGDPKGALASAEKAMQLDPTHSGAIVTYTRAEIAAGEPGKAIAKWKEWVAAHPNDAQAYTMLGSMQESQGDRSGAMESYKKALAIQPEQPIAANNLAVLMVDTNQNMDVALSLAQVARRGMPKSPNTADTLAWVYYQKGNYSSARDLLEDAVKDDPNSASIHYHLGMTYAKLSNKADAVLHLKKAQSLSPNSPTSQEAAKALSQMS